MDEISRLVDSERRRLGELDREKIDIEGRLGELESEGKVNDGEIARAEDECRAKESYRVGQLRKVDTLKGDIRSQDGIVEADAEALSAARSRLEAVEERIDRRENLTGPATLVKEASRDGEGEDGLYALSESVTFREGYEEAAAAVLESVMEALVVDGHEEVLTWQHFLETLGKKGAGFVPRTHAGGRIVPSLPELEGATRLRDQVKSRPEDAEVVARLLAGVYVVDDIDTAISLHKRTRGGAVFGRREEDGREELYDLSDRVRGPRLLSVAESRVRDADVSLLDVDRMKRIGLAVEFLVDRVLKDDVRRRRMRENVGEQCRLRNLFNLAHDFVLSFCSHPG